MTETRRTTDWLERTLGYRCRDAELISAALTHRSAGGVNNERLEFLGDGVLNCVVADHLYRKHPEAREGELSRLRARLVRRESLAEIAGRIGLGELLILGPGELRSGGFRRESILADALEALIGAIYLDGGFEAARGAIEHVMAVSLVALAAVAELKDPKTRLQEYLQARGLQLPLYAIDQVMGESHQQVFVVSCEVVPLGLRGTGSGPSRRAAEQEAADQVLAAIANLPGASTP
ncbi:MAG TPA: ribonuclease III [Steroidobacteraceae bacterium]|nr:ribonuclease III [Steroidobacteraceae bacterium]